MLLRFEVKVRVSKDLKWTEFLSLDGATSNYVYFLHIQIKLLTKPSRDHFVLTLNGLHLKIVFYPNGKLISQFKANS